jgi:hypothetical protein
MLFKSVIAVGCVLLAIMAVKTVDNMFAVADQVDAATARTLDCMQGKAAGAAAACTEGRRLRP